MGAGLAAAIAAVVAAIVTAIGGFLYRRRQDGRELADTAAELARDKAHLERLRQRGAVGKVARELAEELEELEAAARARVDGGGDLSDLFAELDARGGPDGSKDPKP